MRNAVRALVGALLVVGLTPVLAPTRPAAASGGNAVREADATAAAVHDAVATSADRAESPVLTPTQVSQ